MEHELDHAHGMWTGMEFERPAVVAHHEEGHPFEMHEVHEDHHALDHHYDVEPIPMHERTYHDVSIVPISEETLIPIDLTEMQELLYEEGDSPLHHYEHERIHPDHLDEHELVLPDQLDEH